MHSRLPETRPYASVMIIAQIHLNFVLGLSVRAMMAALTTAEAADRVQCVCAIPTQQIICARKTDALPRLLLGSSIGKESSMARFP